MSMMLEKGHKASPTNMPEATLQVIYTNTDRFRQGKQNVRLYRHWAEHSEWIRAAINIRKHQVSQAEWQIVPVDHTRPWSESLRDRVVKLLSKPSPKLDSFRGFIEPIVEDILVLDAGVFEKEFTLRGEVGRLWPVDGGTIKVSTIWDGEDDEEARYFWYPDHQMRASFTNRELVYMTMNAATYRVVGLSPLETLKLAIDSELGSSAFNDRQMRSAAPDGMLDLGENARPDQIENFKNLWASEVAGMGAMAIVGGTKGAKWVPFRASNRDAQFIEWQEYLVRKIAAVMQLAPQDLMLERDVNRSTSEVQQENTDDRGLRPLLGACSDFITREVVWDPGFGGSDNNLQFVFTALNLRESLTRADINRIATGGMPWKSLNEARKDDGRPPLGDPDDETNPYNHLMVNSPLGLTLVDDIPTAREYLESKSKPETPAGGSPPNVGRKTERQAAVEGDLEELWSQR